jgi:hypothetical protein
MTTNDASDSHAGMEKPEALQEHRWLRQLVGEWTFEGEATMGPDQTPEAFKGVERVRQLGDVWFLAEGAGEGGGSMSVATLGYDPQKKRFVGTFIASMMPHLWIYDGSLDAAERVLTLETEGPSMAGDGTTSKYKDVIEVESADRRSMSSHMQGGDGAWTQVMRMSYRRTS